MSPGLSSVGKKDAEVNKREPWGLLPELRGTRTDLGKKKKVEKTVRNQCEKKKIKSGKCFIEMVS